MTIIKIQKERSLLSELSSMQMAGQMCDTRLVADNGSMMVHWAVLKTRGVWWAKFRQS